MLVRVFSWYPYGKVQPEPKEAPQLWSSETFFSFELAVVSTVSEHCVRKSMHWLNSLISNLLRGRRSEGIHPRTLCQEFYALLLLLAFCLRQEIFVNGSLAEGRDWLQDWRTPRWSHSPPPPHLPDAHSGHGSLIAVPPRQTIWEDSGIRTFEFLKSVQFVLIFWTKRKFWNQWKLSIQI